MFLVKVVPQSHGLKGAAGDLLIEKEHEGSGQHRLQQLGLQAFEQTQNAILPTKKVIQTKKKKSFKLECESGIASNKWCILVNVQQLKMLGKNIDH